MSSAYLLFGVRSPLVVEYEETLGRLGQAPVAAVSVNDVPRVLDHSLVVEFGSLSLPERARLAGKANLPWSVFAQQQTSSTGNAWQAGAGQEGATVPRKIPRRTPGVNELGATIKAGF